MKLKVFFFAVIAVILASCSNNELAEVKTDSPKMLRFTATVSEPADTRSILETEGDDTYLKSIRFIWEVGDVIHFSFTQGLATLTRDATVTGVSNGGRTAIFEIPVPTAAEGLQDAPFTVYAYRSGAGSIETNQTIITLPQSPFNYKATLEDQGKRMAIWSKAEVEYDGSEIPPIKLSFQHLGSMFTLHVKNTGGTDITDLHSLALSSGNPNNQSANPALWILNAGQDGLGGARFNMETTEYVSLKGGVTVMFYDENMTIGSGATETYYAWFVPYTGFPEGTPDLYLGSTTDGTRDGISGFTSSPKTAKSFELGKNYVFYATIAANPGGTGMNSNTLNYVTRADLEP